MVVDGMLAGLVALAAPCALVDPWVGALIGLLAGTIVIEAVFLIVGRAGRRPG